MRHCLWIWLLLGAAPLLIYPFVLLANVMSLAGHPSPNPTPLALRITALAFLWSSTFYPFVYIVCTISAVSYFRAGKFKAALNFSMVPFLYLAMVAAFLCGWVITSLDQVLQEIQWQDLYGRAQIGYNSGMTNLQTYYAQLLALDSAWKVKSVVLSLEENRVLIQLVHGGGKLECQECGTLRR